MANDILSRLSPPEGAVKKRRRVGRGTGSNWGKTAGRGHKGHGSRSGGGVHPRFEGGQMPLQRRVPKMGFFNKFHIPLIVVDTSILNKFNDGDVVNHRNLLEKGLINLDRYAIKMLSSNRSDKELIWNEINDRTLNWFYKHYPVKIIADGKPLAKKLTLKVNKVSKSVFEMVENKGGSVELIKIISTGKRIKNLRYSKK